MKTPKSAKTYLKKNWKKIMPDGWILNRFPDHDLSPDESHIEMSESDKSNYVKPTLPAIGVRVYNYSLPRSDIIGSFNIPHKELSAKEIKAIPAFEFEELREIEMKVTLNCTCASAYSFPQIEYDPNISQFCQNIIETYLHTIIPEHGSANIKEETEKNKGTCSYELLIYSFPLRTKNIDELGQSLKQLQNIGNIVKTAVNKYQTGRTKLEKMILKEFKRKIKNDK